MPDKILSIIVPSYNMEAYLPKCLGSLIIEDKELLQKLEVIVVNDGSKDRTSEIAHEFEAKYPGVFRVIDKPNGHYGSCINAALPVATGEFVKVLDADDYVDTEEFGRFLTVVREECERGDSEVDLVVTDYATVDPDGNELLRVGYWPGDRVTTLDDMPSTRLTIHSVCYRTRIVRAMGYRQSEGMPYTDTEWIIEPMIGVRKLRYLRQVVTKYLVGRNGQTMDPKVFAKSFQCILEVTKRLVERYEGYRACSTPESQGYYTRQVVGMVKLAYGWGLCGFEGCRVQGDLDAFDRFLKQYPDFYAEAASVAYGPNHFPFRTVAAWRKHGCSLGWRLNFQLRKLLLNLATAIHYSSWRHS